MEPFFLNPRPLSSRCKIFIMIKAQKITNCISTIWISLGMLSGVIFQLMQIPVGKERFEL
jgi:hypothetical protein